MNRALSNKVYINLLILISFGISFPLYNFIIYKTSLILLIVYWLFSFGFYNKFKLIRKDNYSLLFIAFYLFHFLSLLWSENVEVGIDDLITKSPLFILPIIIASSPRLNNMQIISILKSFILSILIINSYSIFDSVRTYFTNADVSEFRYCKLSIIPTTYQSIFTCFSIFAIIYLQIKNKSFVNWQLYLLILFQFILIVLLESRIVILITLMLIPTFFILYSHSKGKLLNGIKQTGLFFLISIIIINFSPHLKNKTTHTISQFFKTGEDLSSLRHKRCGMIGSVNTPTEGGKQYIGIHVNSPRPNKGDIIEGDLVRLQNTISVLDGEYKVLGTWIDKNGKIGAVDINHEYLARGEKENTPDNRFNGIKTSFCYFEYEKRDIRSLIWDIRSLIWKDGISVINQNFLFGAGVGDSKIELQKKFTINEQRRLISRSSNSFIDPYRSFNYHNQYLESTAAIGIFGASILVLILIISFIRSFKKSDFLFFAFLFIVVLSCFTESILQRQLGVAFFIFFCSVLGINRSNRDKVV